MQDKRLSPGFSTIEEAIEVIQSDTREKPAVDLKYLIKHLKWIETGQNFRIPLMRRLSQEEYAKLEEERRGRSSYVQLSEFQTTGSLYVFIETNYERELLRKVIREKYRELAGHDFQEAIARSTSTVSDDAQGVDAVRPRKVKPNAQIGSNIGSGETLTSNGDGLNV